MSDIVYQQYRVREGYVWVGPDGKGSPATKLVTPDTPGFKKQKHKLEPVIPGQTAPATPAIPVKSIEDRKISADQTEGRS